MRWLVGCLFIFVRVVSVDEEEEEVLTYFTGLMQFNVDVVAPET